jgi:hypothetical protein
MRLRLPLSLLAALLTAFSTPVAHADSTATGTLTIYLLTGQSNAEGAVKSGPLTQDYLDAYKSSSSLLWYNNVAKATGETLSDGKAKSTAWATADTQLPSYALVQGGVENKCMGPEYGFLYTMEKYGWLTTGENNNVAVIKLATDGGGNEYWIQGTKVYQAILSTVKEAVSKIDRTKYTTINIAGLMYLQGESNDASGASLASSRYADLLKNLKSDLEKQGLGSGVNIVIDQSILGQPSAGNNISTTISNLKSYVNSNENASWVSTSDLSCIADKLHYSGLSQLTIGSRYAYQVALLNKLDVGTVRSQEATTLDTKEAWWGDGLSKISQKVAVWDLSSYVGVTKISDTVGQKLSLYGIKIEDTYSGTSNPITLVGGGKSTSSPSESDTTLVLGEGGISVGGILKNTTTSTNLQYDRGLLIGANIALSGNQTWKIGGGSSLTLTGAGSVQSGAGATKNLITGTGDITIEKIADTKGTAVVNVNQSGGSNRTWSLSDGVEFNMGATWSTDNVTVANSASVTLGGYNTSSVNIGALTLGDGSSMTLGSSDTQSFTLTASSLSLGTNVTLAMNVGAGVTDSLVSTSSTLTSLNNLNFKFTYGVGITKGATYIVAENVDSNLDNVTWNKEVTSTLSSLLNVNDKHQLVMTFDGAGSSAASSISAIEFPTTATSVVAVSDSSDSFCATSGLSADSEGIVSAETSSGSCKFYYASQATTASDTSYYAEVDCNNSMIFTGWAVAVGSGSSDKAISHEGDVALKISGDYSGTASSTSLLGALNATTNGNVYLEVDTKDVTYGNYGTNLGLGSVNGVYNSTVNGSVEVVIDSGTYSNFVYGGVVKSGSVSDGTSLLIGGGEFQNVVAAGGNAGTIDGGTTLVINKGTFNGTVCGGGTAGTITGGSTLVVTDGEFNEIVCGGGTGGTVDSVMMVIDGGTFNKTVYGAGSGTQVGSASADGSVTMIIEGGTFSEDVIGAGGSAVYGDVNLIISGGTFDNSKGIYAGASSPNKAVTKNTTVTLSGIDNDNDVAAYTGTLSGSGTEASGKTGTGSNSAGVWGTSTLVLEGYTADSLGMTLKDFDTISLTSNSDTSVSWTNLTVADSVNLASGTKVSVAAENNGVTLNQENLFSGLGTVGLGAGSYTVSAQIMDQTEDNLTALEVSKGSTLKLDNSFTSDKALAVGNLTGSGTVTTDGTTAVLSTAQTSDKSVEFSGTFEKVGLVKDGVGTLVLTGDSANGGELTVESGSVQIGDAGTAGSWGGEIKVAESGTVVWNRSDAVTRDGNLTVDGELVQQGEGQLTLKTVSGSGNLVANTGTKLTVTDIDGFTGSVTGYDDTTVEVGGNWTMGASNFSNTSNLVLLDGATATTGSYWTYSNGVSLEKNATIDVENEAGFMGGIQATNGTLTKSGEGMLTVYDNSSLKSLAMEAGEVDIRGNMVIDTLTDATSNGAVTALRADSADDSRLVNVQGSLTVNDITGYTGAINGAENSQVTVGGQWDMAASTFADSAVVTLKEGSVSVADGFTDSNLFVVDKSAEVQVNSAAEFAGGISASSASLSKTGNGTLTVGSTSVIDTLNVEEGDVVVKGAMKVAHLASTKATDTNTVTVVGTLAAGLSADSSSVALDVRDLGTVQLSGQGKLASVNVSKGSTINLVTDGQSNPTVTVANGLNLADSTWGLTLNTNLSDFASSPAFVVEAGDVNLNGTTIVLGSLADYNRPDTLDDLHMTLVSVTGASSAGTKALLADSATSSISADGVSVQASGYFNFYYNFAVQTSSSEVYLTATLKQESSFDEVANSQNSYAGSQLLWSTLTDSSNSSVLGSVREAIRQDIQLGNTDRARRSLAALAGSTVNALGTAQRDALRDQLGRVKNRVLATGENSELGHHFWIEGTGAYSNVRTQADKGGYKLSTWGGTVGADTQVSQALAVGAALSADSGDLHSVAAERATGDLDSVYVNLFGRYQSKAWGHTLVLTGANNDSSLDRTVDYGAGSYKTHGKTHGYGFGAMYELTYDVALEGHSGLFQPLFNASLVKTNMKGYNETGADNANLHVDEQEWTTATLAVGARWSGSFGAETVGRTINGELRTALAQDFGDTQGKTAVSFASIPGLAQNVYGAKVGSTALQISGGLSTDVSQQGTVYANAGVELRNDANSVNGTIGYRYAF